MPTEIKHVTILGLNFRPEVTGIAPYTSGLAIGLQQTGHDVHVITGYPHYPSWKVDAGFHGFSQRTSEGGITVERLRQYTPSRPSLFRRTLMEMTFGIRAAIRLDTKTDTIICISPSLISTALAMLRIKLSSRRPKTIVWVQDLYSNAAQEIDARPAISSLSRILESRTLKAADSVVVIHERFRKQLTDNLGLDDDRIEVVRNWTHINTAPTNNRDQTRKQWQWREGEIIVVHAGNMGVKQGLINVVRAAQYADRTQQPIRFVLIGDGNQRQTLEAESIGIERIQFLPTLNDLEYRSALQASDVLLVNELSELRDMSVPSKLTSYFAARVPVIAATDATSATSEEIANSGGGLQVEPDDPEKLVHAILRLATDQDLCNVMTDSAWTYLNEKLSSSTAIHNFNSLIDKLTHISTTRTK